MEEYWSITEHYQFDEIFEAPHANLPETDENHQDCSEFSRFRYHGMYTVIENEWVEPLAKWINESLNSGVDYCIEVMSGRGWLAKALENNRVEIMATDDGSDYLHRSRELEYSVLITDAVYPVEKKSTDEVAKYITKIRQEEDKQCLVIISYPPDDNVAFDFVNKLPDGTLIIYIGDEDFELTASEEFGKAINWLNNNQHVNLPKSFQITNFPFLTVEGVGNDATVENTVIGSIMLGIKE